MLVWATCSTKPDHHCCCKQSTTTSMFHAVVWTIHPHSTTHKNINSRALINESVDKGGTISLFSISHTVQVAFGTNPNKLQLYQPWTMEREWAGTSNGNGQWVWSGCVSWLPESRDMSLLLAARQTCWLDWADIIGISPVLLRREMLEKLISWLHKPSTL